MKSVLQKKKECWVCGTELGLHDHHIIFGTANRRKSEKYGLKVWLCPQHHNMSGAGVHHNRVLDLKLKQMAQRHYEEYIGTREAFIIDFGKSYILDD